MYLSCGGVSNFSHISQGGQQRTKEGAFTKGGGPLRVCMYVCICVYVYVRAYLCVYVCVYVCVRERACFLSKTMYNHSTITCFGRHQPQP